jgi:hypothetical protein
MTAGWDGSNSAMAEKHSTKVTSDEVARSMGEEGEVTMAVNWQCQRGRAQSITLIIL